MFNSNMPLKPPANPIPAVLQAPPLLRPFQFPGDLRAGSRAHVTCMATHGDLPLSFKWLLEGAPLPLSLPNIKISTEDFMSHLSISSLTEDHDGTYTCSVANPGGSAQAEAMLRVNVPARWVDTPSNISLLPGQRMELR